MCAGHVLDFHVHDEAHVAGMEVANQLVIILHRPVLDVDAFEAIGEVVVVEGRWIKRREQYACYPEILEVVEPLANPLEIAMAIAVGVEEAPNEDVVKDLSIPVDGRFKPSRIATRRSGISGLHTPGA